MDRERLFAKGYEYARKGTRVARIGVEGSVPYLLASGRTNAAAGALAANPLAQRVEQAAARKAEAWSSRAQAADIARIREGRNRGPGQERAQSQPAPAAERQTPAGRHARPEGRARPDRPER